MYAVVDPNEVLLFGHRYRTRGTVNRILNSPFPAKVTIGEYSRNDQQIASTWITVNPSGGIGKNFPTLPQDQDRYWFGSLETRYQRQITLGPQIVQAGTLKGPADVMIDLSERLYVAVGQSVYRWSEEIEDWELLKSDLLGVPESVAVYNGLLYFVSTSGLDWYDVTSNTWADDPSATGLSLLAFDDKLFRLTLTGQLYWSIDPAAGTWTANAKLPLPPSYCKQMVPYADVTGETVLHAISRVGVYALDFDAAKFYLTSLTYPVAPKDIKGGMIWRSELYVPVDREGRKYNVATDQPIGPDRDDGLPSHVRGEIKYFIPGHGFYYAVLNVVQSQDGTAPIVFDVSQPRNDVFFTPVHSTGAILVSPGMSWHPLYIGNEVGAGMGAGIVASVEGTYRLWFSTGTGIYYSDVGTGLHNPLQNPTTTFKESGYLDTFLFDGGWIEVDKLALSLELSAKQITDTETITIFADWDDSGVWEAIGTVTQNGKTSFRIGGEKGKLFRMVRLRMEMTRGSNPKKTPVLQGLVFSYLLRPDPIWGWELDLDLSNAYKNRSSKQMLEEILDIFERKQAGTLLYRASGGETKEARVVVTGFRDSERTGTDYRGLLRVSVTQVENAEN